MNSVSCRGCNFKKRDSDTCLLENIVDVFGIFGTFTLLQIDSQFEFRLGLNLRGVFRTLSNHYKKQPLEGFC